MKDQTSAKLLFKTREITTKNDKTNTAKVWGKKFKVDEMVSIKIDKVDKTTPMHPNMLIGKITAIENSYAKVVTQFGVIKGLIAPSRLNACTATGVELNYTKEISFSGACKEAHHAK